MSILQKIFLDNTVDGLVHVSIDSPDKNDKKPHFMLGCRNQKKDILVFFVAIKRPDVESKYQEEDDFTKLSKQTRCFIDVQIRANLETPVSYALLCEGMYPSIFEISTKY
ncbi:hypothetical protein PS6_007716 [Mucor atramentarius]